jgi:3-deoxy-D-manno-octulosonate 8-phosphate phosphatase (KDO 8-P phosphatase)
MFLEKIKHIKAFILDVDGVLTNGMVHVTETGEQLRQFNIKDGYAIQLAVKRGYMIVVLSGSTSKGVKLRLEGLGVKNVFLNLDSKTEAYINFLNSSGLSSDQILYVGDDIPDLAVMKQVGLAVCPSDAAEEIKSVSHYISPKSGGEGCVRDIIEKVLRIQNAWFDENPSALDGTKE